MLYHHASQFLGLSEIPGHKDHPWIVWAHSLCGLAASDETAWCSSAMNAWAFGCGLERSKSAAARSWLKVGQTVAIADEDRGDVVILKRGDGPQPGPEILKAPGHVGIFVEYQGDRVLLLGGNQRNKVSFETFAVKDILGIRRLRQA